MGPTNTSVGIINVAVCLIPATLIVCALWQRKKRREGVWAFIALAACALIWAGVSALFYLVPSDDLALRLHEYKYIGIALLPVACIACIMSALGKADALRPVHLALFSLFPLATIALALTNSHHLLFREAFVYVTAPVRIITSTKGVWFMLHTVYSYALILLCVFYLLYQMRVSGRRDLGRVILIGIASLMPLVMNVAVLMGGFFRSLDASLIGTAISLFLYYWACYSFRSRAMLAFARDLVFKRMGSPAFIVDQNRRIVDANQAVEDIAAQLALPLCDVPFEEWISGYVERSGAVLVSNEADVRIRLIGSEGVERWRRIDEMPIGGAGGGGAIGAFIELTDCTREQELLSRLQDMAIRDVMTGLYNRNRYEQELSAVQAYECLPLGIVIGDVNGLKRLNDSAGHEAGDQLLRAVAGILRRNAPERAFIARIGGDEFALLIPNSDELEMQTFCHAVCEDCQSCGREEGFPVSVSTGFALRVTMDEPVLTTMSRADLSMYLNKQQVEPLRDLA